MKQKRAKQKIERYFDLSTTPFLLTKVSNASGGLTLEANVDLILNNVQVAGEIAVQMAKTS